MHQYQCDVKRRLRTYAIASVMTCAGMKGVKLYSYGEPSPSEMRKRCLQVINGALGEGFRTGWLSDLGDPCTWHKKLRLPHASAEILCRSCRMIPSSLPRTIRVANHSTFCALSEARCFVARYVGSIVDFTVLKTELKTGYKVVHVAHGGYTSWHCNFDYVLRGFHVTSQALI